MWIVKFSLKNPYTIAVLVLMISFLGALSLYAIPVDILPAFKAPAVQVMTYFQGVPASFVEDTITNRIERWTNQAAGCRLVESKSTQGVSTVRLYFRDDIDPNGALTEVNSLALGTLATLPPNTLPPVVLRFDPTGTMPIGILSVRNPEMTEAQLNDLARIKIRNMLGGVQGVVAPAVFGGKIRTVLVYVDPVKLEARNLSTKDVVDAIGQSNFMMTPGVAKFGAYEYQLDSNAMVESVAELNDIPIRTNTYLRDVGYAVDASAIQTSMVRITAPDEQRRWKSNRQVYVPIYRQQGASTLAVIDRVNAEIPKMQKKLPPGVKLDVVMDQSTYVREAIHALVHEGAIGVVLVAVMILVFLGNWRMTVIASMSIPLALLCAVIGLQVFGFTINTMTLGGLALAIGPLVDDAIVVLENTHRHHALGKASVKAAFDGAVEVTIPVLVATSTTVLVLLPIGWMPGMGGFLFWPLFVAVLLAMSASFLLSRTLVPVLCARWLKGHVHPGAEHESTGLGRRLAQRIDRGLHWLTRMYQALLAAALRNRPAVLAAVGALFVVSLGLLLFIGQEFFPQVDAGQLTVYVRGPSGINLEENERRIAQVEKALQELIPADDREMIISELGIVPDWSAAYTANSGSQDTTIKVQLSKKRNKSAQEYAVMLRHLFDEDQRFADLHFSFNTGGMISAALNYGVSSPIDIQIEGGSRAQAIELAQNIRDRVRRIPGTADVRVLQRSDAPLRTILVDREKAKVVGLSDYDVMAQVVTAMNSSVSVSRNFWIDKNTGNQYYVGVQYPEDANMKLEDVMNIVATGATSPHPVKLGDLVRLVIGTAPVEASHVNLDRVTNIHVNTEGRDIGSVARDIRAVVPELVDPPEGITQVRLRGEFSRMQRSFGNLGAGLAGAAVLVYLLLVALFRSFVGPFIIMFAVPLGLIGVLWMLFLTHTSLNVQSSMGVIFMVGIVVANSVLLVDFANKQRKLGASTHKAITTAAAIRFRPILMTFFATFLDLLPMAIGLGRGSEANVPLARAVVGGLLTSTFLTLIVVPVMYTLLISDSEEPEIDIDKELTDPVPPRVPAASGIASGCDLSASIGAGMQEHSTASNTAVRVRPAEGH